jgi:hypothetical protein
MTPLIPPRDEQPPKITIDSPVITPTADSQMFYAVRQLDLKRIQRNLEKIRKQPFPFSIIYSLFFGITVTAGLTTIPLAYAQGLSPWVIPLYVVITVASGVCGGVFLALDLHFRNQRKEEASEVETDMNDILSCYDEKPKTPEYLILPIRGPMHEGSGLRERTLQRNEAAHGKNISVIRRDMSIGGSAKIEESKEPPADEEEKW